MKRILAYLLFLSLGCTLSAQSISITGFSLLETDFSAMNRDTRRLDRNGEPCALLRIETTETGFTFDGGLIGVTDVSYHKGEVWVYMPRGARKLSVSHSRFGYLRDWPFPFPVEGGRTYLLTLEAVPPAPVVVQDTVYNTVYVDRYVDRVIERKVRAPRIRRPRPDFSPFGSHYAYTTLGMSVYEGDVIDMSWGLGYAFVPGRVGGYASVLFDEGDPMVNAGPVVRLTGGRGPVDLQVYAGAGTYGGYCMSGDMGIRFSFRSEVGRKLSLWDVSMGCSYADGTYCPYMSFGIGITGSVLGICLGLLCSM